MGLCAEQLYKMVLMFFQKNEKHLIFSRNTTKWFYIFWDLARDWVWLYKMALVLFKKQRIHLQNVLQFFLGKCKLIDSKMIEPYSMVYKIPGNLKISEVISTKWFVK
jgi:hypothetical protein